MRANLHVGAIMALLFLPDGRLVSGSATGDLVAWDARQFPRLAVARTREHDFQEAWENLGRGDAPCQSVVSKSSTS